MTEALLDTDILSFYFRNDYKVVSSVNSYLERYSQLNISIITYYEILAGLKFKRAERQLRDFEEFVLNNNVIHLLEESAKISGRIYASLRQNGVIVSTSDILIAGVAIENDLTLITNNERHFEPIVGLRLENWKK